MATLQTTRAPLGGIDEARLRNIANKKNSQNGMLPPSSLKRRRDIESDPAFDPENVDPVLFSPKKAKTGTASFEKPQHYVFKSAASASSLTPTARQLATPKRLQKHVEKISPVSYSAPAAAPAGRSPTKSTKRAGILSKKRSCTRVDPPKFGLVNSSPLSLNAAISGSLGNKARPARVQKSDACSLDEAMPNGWFFQIHEDSMDDHASNMIQHSTCILDLSDEEERRRREIDERGKENIPPADYAGPGSTRRDMMTDDSRLPLGMLDTAEFYGAGVDANCFVVIEDDGEKKQAVNVAAANAVEALMDPSPTDAVSTGRDTFQEVMAMTEDVAPEPAAAETAPEPVAVHADVAFEYDTQLEVQSSQEPPIDIWESESAKGDETEVPEPITVTTPLQESIAAAEAREEAALEAHEGAQAAYP